VVVIVVAFVRLGRASDWPNLASRRWCRSCCRIDCEAVVSVFLVRCRQVVDAVATVVAGFLYTLVSPAAAFGYAAAWMAAAVVRAGLLRSGANSDPRGVLGWSSYRRGFA
jgi:hypothetical protein